MYQPISTFANFFLNGLGFVGLDSLNLLERDLLCRVKHILLFRRMDKSFGNSGGRSDSGFRGSSAASSHGLLDATGWEDSSGYSHTTR